MKDVKRKRQYEASTKSHNVSKKLKKKLPHVEVVMEQPSTPKAKAVRPSIASPITSTYTGSSIFQTPQHPKSHPRVKGKQDAANGFSRASAKFCESRRISLQIQDELDKQAHRRNTVKAESPSSMLANASKDEKELQLDVLLSIDHNLDRIAKALEELVESIPVFAK